MKDELQKLAAEMREYAAKVEAIANPEPDPWAKEKAAYADGKVIQYADDYLCEWMDCDHPLWVRSSRDNPNPRYRVKPEEPWTLSRQLPGFRALRDEEEWHRLDFTKEMLEGGWRPLLCNEPAHQEDWIELIGGVWVSDSCDVGFPMQRSHLRTRTKRPLPILTPQQIAEGWIEWHGGPKPAPGKRVSLLLRDGSKGAVNQPSEELVWSHLTGASYIKDPEIIAYRVIELKRVPLGPDDVRCGDELKMKTSNRHEITMVSFDGVSVSNFGFRSWAQLQDGWLIRRRDSATFEPCIKGAEQ